MEDEPQEDPVEKTLGDAETQVREKADEFRMFAELAAIYEGVRKFDAELKPSLSRDIARDVQQTMAKLEKARPVELPFIPAAQMPEAARILDLYETASLSTNDYHIHRRPGEAMIIRWLAGDEVETFYKRLQAHFDANLNNFREDERSSKSWKADDKINAYLEALDKLEVKLEINFLREPIKQTGLAVLSTQTADEMNIAFLCDQIMGVPAADVVGDASAPPEEPKESDLAWFFKLFLLRGVKGDLEQMCFFTFLQKTDDSFDF